MRIAFPLILLVLLSSSCNNNSASIQQEDKDCNSLIISGHAFAGEERIVTINNKIVYQKKFDSRQKVYTTRDLIYVDYPKKTHLRIQTNYNSVTFIDTTFTFKPNKDERFYEVGISLPHPFKVNDYIKNGRIVKKWGYLPIDSSQRYIGLYPASYDTTYYQ